MFASPHLWIFVTEPRSQEMLVGGLDNWNIWDEFGSKGLGRPLGFDRVPGAGHVPRLCSPAVKHPGPAILQQPAEVWSQLQPE